MAATFHQVNTFEASPKRIYDILMRSREHATMNRERKSKMIPEAARRCIAGSNLRAEADG